MTCLDLFSGCGGFTLGMQRAGFRVLAAVDFYPEAVATLRSNLVDKRHPEFEPVVHALERDLTKFQPGDLASLIQTPTVDVIVGGPPCQGFSTARQVDGSNHGNKLIDDPRRNLYKDFLRFVEHFQPKVFVMENVLGLRSAAGGAFFTAVQKDSRDLGYRVHSQIEDAWQLGVPQKRRRQLIIGVHAQLPGYFQTTISPAPRAIPNTPLGAAIADLPILRAGGGTPESEYQPERRDQLIASYGAKGEAYLHRVLEVHFAKQLTNHVARPHSDRDLKDFEKLREGENSATAIRDRNVEFLFPYDKGHFKDRYTRQHRLQPCSTIVAHLSKDGLMFIHPTQNRSLTPREAARVQSFPDWFVFPKAQTHAFKQIGNAVPPLVGEAVGLEIRNFLLANGSNTPSVAEDTGSHSVTENLGPTPSRPPSSRTSAASDLEKIAWLDRKCLRKAPMDEFLKGWHALLFLFPGLHPDNALDHGETDEPWPDAQLLLPGLEEQQRRRYCRSGWPVILEAIGQEAWRRYKSGQLQADELYCIGAQRAGLLNEFERNNAKIEEHIGPHDTKMAL